MGLRPHVSKYYAVDVVSSEPFLLFLSKACLCVVMYHVSLPLRLLWHEAERADPKNW